MGIQFNGLASGLDTQSIVTELMAAESYKVEKIEKKQVLVEWKKEAWEEVNSKLYSFYKEELFDFKSSGTYSQKKVTSSDESVLSVNTSTNAVRGLHTIDVTELAKGSFLTGTELTADLNGDSVTNSTTASDLFGIASADTTSIFISLKDGDTPTEVVFSGDDTLYAMTQKIKDLDLDLNVSFDEKFGRMFFSSTETGEGVALKVTGDEAALDGLGFDTGNREGSVGSDAAFTYNGTEFTSETNEVTINGLSVNLLGKGESTIGVSQDTDAIYDKVKEFIAQYNILMTEMNTKIGADATTDYEPLTDDEKEAMTDDEIETWETTIKDSILRRDTTMTSLRSTLRNTLTLSSGVDTSEFTFKTLSSLGIVTGSYTEAGLLHIQGDEDDSLYSSKDNKLRDAIDDDPDAVMELLTALGKELYSNFSSKMQSNSLSSAFTFYNDKSMDSMIDDYEDDIYDLEDMMDDMETRYYAQFTAMEQAIQQSNSTGDWLSQQLGG